MAMAIETERKFFVDRNRLEEIKSISVSEKVTEYGYIGLAYTPEIAQVRISHNYTNNICRINIKGLRNGADRMEWEWKIEQEEADALLNLIPHKVKKVRRRVVIDGWIWDVDEYVDKNAPLVIAECEYSKEVEKDIVIPDWCLYEVTDDNRFYNKELAFNPYSAWCDSVPGIGR